MMKVPWMLVVGGREAGNDQVAPRVRHADDKGVMSVDQAIKEILDAAANKS